MLHYTHIETLNEYDDQRTNALLQLMPPSQAALLRQAPVRLKERVAAYHLLVNLLQKNALFVNMPIYSIGEHNKPSLANYPSLHFNLSHSGTCVAVAICDKPVGIDVQVYHRLSKPLLQRVCNPQELQTIQQSQNPEREFARLWTRKEALLKMIGIGLTRNLRNVLQEETDYQMQTIDLCQVQASLSLCVSTK